MRVAGVTSGRRGGDGGIDARLAVSTGSPLVGDGAVGEGTTVMLDTAFSAVAEVGADGVAKGGDRTVASPVAEPASLSSWAGGCVCETAVSSVSWRSCSGST